MFVYAVANHKGGVGRTTTAATLGAAFVRLGRRVLLIDLDSQSSLTASVGAAPAASSVEDVLDEPRTVLRSIVHCASGMDILPARPSLAIRLQAIASEPRASFRMAMALATIGERFDTVVIDCAAGIDAGLANALTAAHVVLAPIQGDYLSLRGLADTQAICDVIRQTANPRLKIRSFANMCGQRTRYEADALAEARAALETTMLATTVPRSVRFARAHATGTTVFDFAPRSPGAEAYCSLARELLDMEKRYGTAERYSSGDPQPAQRASRGGGASANA